MTEAVIALPVTPVQRAYLAGRSDGFVLGGVGTLFYAEYRGSDFDVIKLTHATRALIRRREALRAVFSKNGRQKILPAEVADGFEVSIYNFQDLPTSQAMLRYCEIRLNLSHRLFDESRWPLFSIDVTYLPKGRARLHVAIDMLLVDAYSAYRLLDELYVLYRGLELPLVRGNPLSDWLHKLPRDRSNSERAVTFWREQLKQLPFSPKAT